MDTPGAGYNRICGDDLVGHEANANKLMYSIFVGFGDQLGFS
jgi:hypothetical protein